MNGKRVAFAAISIVMGVALAGMGVAGAAPLPSQFVIIRFNPSADQVTLQIPTPPCKRGPPGCVWRLGVDEPYAPGAPQLGVATGMSGLLTVTYPSTACGGVIQADASIMSFGEQTWRYEVGHRMAIVCPGTTPTPTGTTKTLEATTAAQLPSTAGTSASTDPNHQAVETAAVAQLPFTGIDVKPLAFIGMALVLGGLLLASRFEQRRRSLRRLLYAARLQRDRAWRASRWFLGQ